MARHELSPDDHEIPPAAFSDSDGDDYEHDSQATLVHSRTSEDRRLHDQETLLAEEEAERLLASGAAGKTPGWFDGRVGWDKRKRRRRREKDGEGEMRQVLYEVEEGGGDEKIGMEDGEEEDDWHQLAETQARQRQKKKTSRLRFAALHLAVVAAFFILLYGAWTVSSHRKPAQYVAQSRSNGTHVFAPTTLLISLDGFRADFLARGLTPTLDRFIRTGISPEYMLPVFPSLTFPNHFTIVTGMHPESHGIVGNTFWDPEVEKEFYYTDPDRSLQPEWWNAEPLWLTAELAGVRSAIHMWPGSEAHIGSVAPAYVDDFNADEALDKKVDRILHWLDLPGPDDAGADDAHPRPQFIAAYVPNVDADGHLYGPNSTEIRSTIHAVDDMLGTLFAGLAARNLSEIVNVVVVSDHGMATTSARRLVQLEDLVDPALIAHIDGWPLYGLRPHNRSDAHLHELYDQLRAKAALPVYQNSFQVYLRDHDMPPHYHFSANPRIAPLWLVPKAGWAIVTREEYDLSSPTAGVYHPRGLHGYDHQHPLMRAIFVARGPAFPHPPASKVPVFQNLEVYNIVCESLGLVPGGNNGSLTLPLKTIGVHGEDWPGKMGGSEDLPDGDFGDDVDGGDTGVQDSSGNGEEDKESGDDTEEKDKDKDGVGWWDWIKNRLSAIKGWAAAFTDKLGKDGKKNGDGGDGGGGQR